MLKVTRSQSVYKQNLKKNDLWVGEHINNSSSSRITYMPYVRILTSPQREAEIRESFHGSKVPRKPSGTGKAKASDEHHLSEGELSGFLDPFNCHPWHEVLPEETPGNGSETGLGRDSLASRLQIPPWTRDFFLPHKVVENFPTSASILSHQPFVNC